MEAQQRNVLGDCSPRGVLRADSCRSGWCFGGTCLLCAVQQRDAEVPGLLERQGVEGEGVVVLLRGARRTDLDLGEAEDAVDRGRGQLDGPDPVEPCGQHLATDQPALELDLRGRDPELRREEPQHAQHDGDRDAHQLPQALVVAAAEHEDADQHRQELDQLEHRVDEQHPRVEPLPGHLR